MKASFYSTCSNRKTIPLYSVYSLFFLLVLQVHIFIILAVSPLWSLVHIFFSFFRHNRTYTLGLVFCLSVFRPFFNYPCMSVSVLCLCISECVCVYVCVVWLCVKNCPTLIYLFNIKVLSETPLKCPFCRLAKRRLPASLLPVCVCPSFSPESRTLLSCLLLLLLLFVVGSLNIKKVFSPFCVFCLENENKFKMQRNKINIFPINVAGFSSDF